MKTQQEVEEMIKEIEGKIIACDDLFVTATDNHRKRISLYRCELEIKKDILMEVLK